MAKAETANYIKVTQVKSAIGRIERQKRTIKALGLGKINSSSVLPENPAVRGMVAAVAHLVRVEPADAKAVADRAAEKPLNMSISGARRLKGAKMTKPVKAEVASSGGLASKAEIASSGEIASKAEIAPSPKEQAPRNDVKVEAKADVKVEAKAAAKVEAKSAVAKALAGKPAAKKPVAKKTATATKKPAVAKKPAAKKTTTPKKETK